MTEKPQNTRAFIGKVHRYTRDAQIADCKAAVKKYELPAIGRGYYDYDEIKAFISDLHSDEVALLPRLECVATKKGRGVVIAFLSNVYQIDTKSLRIIDIDSGITSDDDNWFEYVEAVAMKIMNGRPLTKEHSAYMNEMRREKRKIEPGLVESWQRKRKQKTPDYMACAAIWGNLGIKPEKKAKTMLPDEELQESSTGTIRRIFGSRSECAAWLNNRL